MSTRSIIVITGQEVHRDTQTTRLYKHSDGYPTGNLPAILEALKIANDQIKGQNDRAWTRTEATVTHSQLMGLLIGQCTSAYGMGLRLEKSYQGELKPIHLGSQFDLEWIYVIDTDKKSLSIYGGGYSGESPQKILKEGTVNPMTYAEILREECQEEERKNILKLIDGIEKEGFKVNAA
mgnify:CR=1 FL=1